MSISKGFVSPQYAQGVLPYQDVGEIRPDIKFRGKICGKVQPSSPNKRKNLGSSVTTRPKSWERITILGAFEVIFEIQMTKFGVFVTYIFGGKIWGPDTNCRGKFWGQPPRPPYMEVPSLDQYARISVTESNGNFPVNRRAVLLSDIKNTPVDSRGGGYGILKNMSALQNHSPLYKCLLRNFRKNIPTPYKFQPPPPPKTTWEDQSWSLITGRCKLDYWEMQGAFLYVRL